mmetsp:Transcript_1986/g.4711  ORF Transcript_1986/g.4711 Transcript_1986/m.4711 type:complete len:213 (+) Transcript_1986:125-763(+)
MEASTCWLTLSRSRRSRRRRLMASRTTAQKSRKNFWATRPARMPMPKLTGIPSRPTSTRSTTSSRPSTSWTRTCRRNALRTRSARAQATRANGRADSGTASVASTGPTALRTRASGAQTRLMAMAASSIRAGPRHTWGSGSTTCHTAWALRTKRTPFTWASGPTTSSPGMAWRLGWPTAPGSRVSFRTARRMGMARIVGPTVPLGAVFGRAV